MRAHILTGLVLLLPTAGACLDAEGASTGATVRVRLADGGALVGCYRVSVFDAQGGVTAESGGYDASSAEVLRAGGALCNTPAAPGATAAAARADVIVPCTPGPSEVGLELIGAFEADGSAVHAIVDPCGATGCVQAFECLAGRQVEVEYTAVTLLRDTSVGFFDITVDVDAPVGAAELCYGVAVIDGDGNGFAEASRLCSGEHGNGWGGDVAYIMPCNADAPDHTVVLFVHDPGVAGWDNPCPALGGGDTPSLWAGGCAREVTCLDNVDVTVGFDLSPSP